MTSYQIKKLHPEDYDRCSNIIDMEKNPKVTKMFYEELVKGNRVTFIYIENNEYIGEGSLVFERNDPDYTILGRRVYLSRMIVKEEHRNRGIGSILLRYLTEYAAQLGYTEVALGVNLNNTHARHMYEKNGFTRVLYTGEDQYGKYVKLLKKLR